MSRVRVGFVIAPTLFFIFITFSYILYEISAFSNYDFLNAIRVILSSISFAYVFFIIVNLDYIPNRKHIYFIFSVFIVVALLQSTLGRDILNFVISNPRGNENRGLRLLSPEPTEATRSLLFLLLLSSVLHHFDRITKKEFHLFYLIGFILVLITASLTGLVYLIFFTFMLFFISDFYSKKNATVYFFIIFSLIILYFFILYYFSPDSRLFNILNLLVSDPYLILEQGGFKLRALNIIHSVYIGIIYNNGLGFGLLQPSNFDILISYDFLGRVGEYFNPAYENKTQGGFVGIIYNLGFLSLPLFYLLYKIFHKIYIINCHSSGSFFYFFLFSFLLLTFFEGSIFNPYVGLLLAIYYMMPSRILK